MSGLGREGREGLCLKGEWRTSKDGETMGDVKVFACTCALKFSLQPHDVVKRAATWEWEDLRPCFLSFHTKLFYVICIFFSYHPPGHQEAIAVCLHIQTQQTVNDSLCDMVHRPPAMSQACNTEPCPPRYALSYVPGVHYVWRVTLPPAEKLSCA